MCGIIGYTGSEDAIPRLLSGLKALEYRGYDSAGVAFFSGCELSAVKSGGRLSRLEDKLSGLGKSDIHAGIGHTRWATHGEPSDANAHPHGNGRVYVVHNGIIENYCRIEEMLRTCGYTFTSETDTERAALLIDHLYGQYKDPINALREASNSMTGSFALGVMFSDIPDTIFAMRKDSPLLISQTNEGTFMESDISAVLRYTNKFVRLEDGEIAILKGDGVTFISADGKYSEKEFESADWDVEAAEKSGYEHFMLKEIYEEPSAVRKTLNPRIREGLPALDMQDLTEKKLKRVGMLHIVACGTAMHAGLVGKYAIEKMARIPVCVEIASEFRYRDPILGDDDVVLVVSQSGETADTLAALRLAKERGVYTIAVVNVPGSTIAKEADDTLYTWAGPEIAVASTKAYSVQIALLYLLAIRLGMLSGHICNGEASQLCEALCGASSAIERALLLDDKCRRMANRFKGSKGIFFIGRGHDYALSMEAALKMKEISYIHCEAYAAGELKHGTISLIEKGTPVFAFATAEDVLDKMISNIREVKSRGADVLVFVPEGTELPEDAYDERIEVPRLTEIFMPISAITPAQLLAYYTALYLGCDVDKPRNLAKSVTVE